MEDQRERKNSQQILLDDRRVIRLLAKLSLPAMIALLVNTLYTMVDMLFVGRSVGPVDLAAWKLPRSKGDLSCLPHC